MPKIFDRVGTKAPRYSAFNLSREQKLSCNMGELIPTYLEEVVPGDQFNVRTEVMLRMAPMMAPVMHRVNVYLHYFYVPNRIIWNQWEEFITGGKEGTSDPLFPTISMNNLTEPQRRRLADYLGLPVTSDTTPGQGGNYEVSALPFRAYTQIWNEYYRDQNLQDEVDVETDTLGIADLRRRAWEKDYFTSALPFAQRGPEVGIPIDFNYRDNTELSPGSTGGAPPETDQELLVGPTIDGRRTVGTVIENQNRPVQLRNLEEESVSASINQLRRSSALQRWLEKSARGGSRYIETILAHFNKRVPDHRINRPEYLGGGQQPVVISEVLNTTGTEENEFGDLAGHGISSGQTNKFNYNFPEHGYVIGILSVLPRTAYQQGIPKHWQRRDRFEYYWPEFANLGEQEIKNSELYFDFSETPESNEGTFGYQQRYAEYKYGNSTVHGAFRTNLNYWHLGRIFENRPSLNRQFIMADPDTRIFAVEETDHDHLWIQMYHNVKARRPMPYFSDPRLT